MRIRKGSTTTGAALLAAAAIALAGCGESTSNEIEEMEGGGDVGVEEDVGEELPEG